MSAETDCSTSGQVRLYVRLLGEGTEVFRPAWGVEVGPMVFRLVQPDDYDPTDETWEFPPGTTVRGKAIRRGNAEVIVADAEAESG
jgi:hypothetical protein